MLCIIPLQYVKVFSQLRYFLTLIWYQQRSHECDYWSHSCLSLSRYNAKVHFERQTVDFSRHFSLQLLEVSCYRCWTTYRGHFVPPDLVTALQPGNRKLDADKLLSSALCSQLDGIDQMRCLGRDLYLI